ncbi:MAG: methyl-accepting chemotaxis protein [Synergistaceae bacterium]|jgi:methyl-accepting chemotaxis protein|nr:methyl-accepting chemotaxis protein [Synergistaceae bacterium]
MRNISIMAKILLLVSIMIVLLIIVSSAGYIYSSNMSDKADEMYQKFASPAIWMLDSKSMATDARRAIGRVSSLGPSYLNIVETMVNNARKNINENFSKYENSDMSDMEKKIYLELQQARSQVAIEQDDILKAVRDNNTAKLARIETELKENGRITLLENNYAAKYDELSSLLVEYADESHANLIETAYSAEMFIAVIAVATVVTGILLGVLIARLITSPIRETQKKIVAFSEGDITCSFDTYGKDEIATMGQSLQNMADNLSKIISSVKRASGEIAETAQEFSSLSEETNASLDAFRMNVESMSSNLNALASTGEEVNASVEEVAAGAQATAERGTDIARKVHDAMNAGENGMDSVRRAVSSIDGVARNASESAKSIQELGSRTRQIQNFVSQIGGIADQTNLLALNAAIEAARAGEAGRGFAVVAEEVRKLAEDSNIAAKNIEELAETISNDLDNVVSISLDNAKASKGAKDLSKETEEIIGAMISYLKEIVGSTQDLAAVSEEQAASSEEIAEAIQNIATRVGNTAASGENIKTGVTGVSASTERVALGAEELSKLAGNLRDLLLFFHIEDRPASSPSTLPSSGRAALPAGRPAGHKIRKDQ